MIRLMCLMLMFSVGCTLTHAQTLTATDTSTTYELYEPPFKVTDYNNAINAALDESYAKGFARRGWDETLYTTQQLDYTLPSTLEEVGGVFVQSHGNYMLDPDWVGSGSGWTVHSVGSFGNNGDNQERTLDHVITGANQYTTTDVSVTPGVKYFFRVRAISVSSSPTAVARYQFRTSTGALIGSATNFGTYASATSGLITGTFIAPVNAVEVRIGLGSSSASGTVRFWEHDLMRYQAYERWPRGDWDLEWEGNTARIIFKRRPMRFRILRLQGRRSLETLTADSDTVSFDAPESRAFIRLALTNLWSAPHPHIDEAQALRQEALWRGRFAEVAGGLFENYQARRSYATPSWG